VHIRPKCNKPSTKFSNQENTQLFTTIINDSNEDWRHGIVYKDEKDEKNVFTKTYNKLMQILSEQEPSEGTVKVKFSTIECLAKELSALES
jgi:ribonuclease HII